MRQLSSTARLAWAALAINIATVLGGSLVRATNSGAGCGESWPSCQGTIIPGFEEVATRIEFAHRAVSGLALLSVLLLLISVYRNYSKGSPARRAVGLTAIAIVVESLLGAWLVLARLVEDNASVMRAISMPVHLVNTLFLLAALTVTAWIVTTNQALRWSAADRNKLIVAFIGMVVLGATGAIAALADTLFPAESLAAGLKADFTATSHFLTKMRIAHPVFAIAMGAFLLHLAGGAFYRARRPAIAVIMLVCLQLGIGALNVLLLTPLPIQLLHLLVADLLWIAVLILGAELGRISSIDRPRA